MQAKTRKQQRNRVMASFTAHTSGHVNLASPEDETEADEISEPGQQSLWKPLISHQISHYLQELSTSPSSTRGKGNDNRATSSSLVRRPAPDPSPTRNVPRQPNQPVAATTSSLHAFVLPDLKAERRSIGQFVSALTAQRQDSQDEPYGRKQCATSSLGTVSPTQQDQENKLSQSQSSPVQGNQTTEESLSSDTSISEPFIVLGPSNASTKILQNPARSNGFSHPIQLQNNRVHDGSISISKTPAVRPTKYRTYDADIYHVKDIQQRLVTMTIKLAARFPEDVSPLGDELDVKELRKLPKVYIFVDFSNIFAGAEAFIKEHPPNDSNKLTLTPSMAFLDLLFSRSRNVFERYMATSEPGKRFENIWDEIESAKEKGYQVRVLERVRGKEQMVDELLQKRMSELLLDHVGEPGILVLATGDGNESELNDGGFPTAVERYLHRGWKIELYSWEYSTSTRFVKLEKQHPASFRIIYLREWAKYIFEVRGGKVDAGGIVESSPSRAKFNGRSDVISLKKVTNSPKLVPSKASHGKSTWGDSSWRRQYMQRRRVKTVSKMVTGDSDHSLRDTSPEPEPAPIFSPRNGKHQQQNQEEDNNDPFQTKSLHPN